MSDEELQKRIKEDFDSFVYYISALRVHNPKKAERIMRGACNQASSAGAVAMVECANKGIVPKTMGVN